MSSVFALYIPQPSELWSSIAVLALVFLVLCGCAHRVKLSVWKSVLAMMCGVSLATILILISVWNADLGDYGDRARAWSSTTYSDRFFAVVILMKVGWGKMYVFAGMAGGFLLVVLGKGIRRWRGRAESSLPRDSVRAC